VCTNPNGKGLKVIPSLLNIQLKRTLDYIISHWRTHLQLCDNFQYLYWEILWANKDEELFCISSLRNVGLRKRLHLCMELLNEYIVPRIGWNPSKCYNKSRCMHLPNDDFRRSTLMEFQDPFITLYFRFNIREKIQFLYM
jgi:hypothetical protein